jgi:hypothetical protein
MSVSGPAGSDSCRGIPSREYLQANRHQAVHWHTRLTTYKNTVAKNQHMFKIDGRFYLASDHVLYIQDCLGFNPQDGRLGAIKAVKRR